MQHVVSCATGSGRRRRAFVGALVVGLVLAGVGVAERAAAHPATSVEIASVAGPVTSATVAASSPGEQTQASAVVWHPTGTVAQAVRHTAPRRSSGRASTRRGSGRSGAATSGAVPVPAGGKTCTSAGAGAVSADQAAVGAEINAYRQSHGLPALSVSQSGMLTTHAVQMANSGGIWHSGADNIVGCVSNASAASLVVAWSQSAPHNAQLLRTDVSQMAVGGATQNGWLYAAVAFR